VSTFADASDTQVPSAKVDTAPQSSRSGSKSRRNLQAQRRKNILIIILIGAVIVIPLIVAGVFGGLLWWYFSVPPGGVQPAQVGPPTLHVSKSKTGNNFHTSIGLALQKAQQGSVIELLDTEHAENLVIDPARIPTTHVTLRAAPGNQVTWRSRTTDQDEPIIKLSRASDFKFEGKGITLDGTLSKGRVRNLMMIMSDCRALTVEDLRFTKFARTAVLLMNTAGTASQPIRLHRLTTVTDRKAENPLAPIYFDANPKIPPVKNNHIEIQGCTFSGFEPSKGVQSADPKVIDTDVRWPERGKN
jgi:hypothetical protein